MAFDVMFELFEVPTNTKHESVNIVPYIYVPTMKAISSVHKTPQIYTIQTESKRNPLSSLFRHC